MRIGLIIEGSNDFAVLGPIVAEILAEVGKNLNAFDSIQPVIDATSQVTGGGWGRVRGWCEANAERGYRIFLDEPLFASSPTYDILLIHLDGDVVGVISDGILGGMDLETSQPQDIAYAIRNAVKNEWLKVDPNDDHRIVVAAPVLHMEAWIAGCLLPGVAEPEANAMKDTVRQQIIGPLVGRQRERHAQAGEQSAQQLARGRHTCSSLAQFDADLKRAAAHA